MISAWDVYWVMQLDSLKGTAEWFAWMATFAAAGGAVVRVLRHEDDAPAFGRFAWRSAIAACVAAAIATVVPSSKTAAAMIVLPALTSDAVTEPLSTEAAELYGLAKKALAKVAEPEPEPASD